MYSIDEVIAKLTKIKTELVSDEAMDEEEAGSMEVVIMVNNVDQGDGISLHLTEIDIVDDYINLIAEVRSQPRQS